MAERCQQLPGLVRATAVRVIRGCVVQVRFMDGTTRDIDLSPYLRGPVFEVIPRDPVVFRQMSIVSGVLTWPNGADIDPDMLYYGTEPAWAAEERTPQA